MSQWPFLWWSGPRVMPQCKNRIRYIQLPINFFREIFKKNNINAICKSFQEREQKILQSFGLKITFLNSHKHAITMLYINLINFTILCIFIHMYLYYQNIYKLNSEESLKLIKLNYVFNFALNICLKTL